MATKYKNLHFQGMGSFNWFRITAWNPLKRLVVLHWLDCLIKTLAGYGIPENSGIMFISDGRGDHRNLNRKTPWKCWEAGGRLLFDLATWNRKYWKLFRKFLKVHKKYHVHFVPILFMRENYLKYPFTYNVNNVHGFWDPGAWKYLRKYVLKVMKCYQKVYGSDYKPRVIIANEMAHGGSPEKFHDIMYFHLDIKNLLVPEFTSLKHIWVDLTACEGAGGELREPHNCPYPGASNCRGGRHGTSGQNRLFMGINHRFFHLNDFLEKVGGKTRLEIMEGSANHWRLYTGDGLSRTNSGNRVIVIRGREFHVADADELYDMMKRLCEEYQRTGFLFKYGYFPHEALFYDEGKNLYVPDYRVKKIDWDSIGALHRACQEVLGDDQMAP